MFTGLVQDLGKVTQTQSNDEGKLLTVESQLAKLVKINDSVSVNGACQTVIAHNEKSFSFQSIHVTLEKTTLGGLNSGDNVNLELALRMGDRLGGHLVQGHVNGTAKINNIEKIGKNWNVWIEIPKDQDRYFVKEGSICVDGISLTIADLKEDEFCVSIIPHTYDKTNLHLRNRGDLINIEVDIMAKYIERLLPPIHNNNKIDRSFLKDKGF